MVSHLDHSEHSVNIIATEQGVADLRGKGPKERAQTIIEKYAHPDYKELLWDYVKFSGNKKQTPHILEASLAMHSIFNRTGDMRNTKWDDFIRV